MTEPADHLALIKKIVHEHLGVSPEKVDMNSNFEDDLGADELDIIEFTMAIEEEIGVVIPDEVCERIGTVSDLVEYLSKQKMPPPKPEVEKQASNTNINSTPPEHYHSHAEAEYRAKLLTHLQEEASEVIQEVCKIVRFGFASHHPADPDKTTNLQRLSREVGNFWAIVDLLNLPEEEIKKGIEMKQENLQKYDKF